MELRQTEAKVKELQQAYEKLRYIPSFMKEAKNGGDNDAICKQLSSLPPLQLVAEDDNGGGDKKEPSSQPSISVDHAHDPSRDGSDADGLLQHLQSLQTSVQELQPKMERFQVRLGEVDPITEKPRYGAKTAKRVDLLLRQYQELLRLLQLDDVLDQLQSLVTEKANQRAHQIQQQKEAQQHQEQLQLERLQHQQQQQTRQQQLQEETRQQQLAQLHRMAESSRQARQEAEQARLEQARRQREEAERRDREWVESIQQGPAGIQKQLQVLRKSVSSKAEWEVAINALHTLFQQIVAHPEETNFRRIRRDHPRFMEDIGRHDGGTEVLIAAGFWPGFIDEVPSYISSEPNLETDMDGWAKWFELLKAALAEIEEVMIKG